ncbi:hypothetical protein M378DRAFT_156452 [Amanita muscaria Koide BX008]|uniref:Uncharacterized protein n=1 Tax=Amanita muscaria (strain Koide BX008) TaxID=946122 RepID=A0A0C2TSR7_AMAMK|nr:hypothetical protein M378DRAFT_156452 [Amanita muscaria Koide BX008]
MSNRRRQSFILSFSGRRQLQERINDDYLSASPTMLSEGADSYYAQIRIAFTVSSRH